MEGLGFRGEALGFRKGGWREGGREGGNACLGFREGGWRERKGESEAYWQRRIKDYRVYWRRNKERKREGEASLSP